jgi:hypothetical protein
MENAEELLALRGLYRANVPIWSSYISDDACKGRVRVERRKYVYFVQSRSSPPQSGNSLLVARWKILHGTLSGI